VAQNLRAKGHPNMMWPERFQGRGADGAAAVGPVEDGLTEEICEALDAAFDQEPSKELDPGRSFTRPDELDVRISNTPGGAEFVEGGGEQRTTFLRAEREGALVWGTRERRLSHNVHEGNPLS
jgi:hypothetical protein